MTRRRWIADQWGEGTATLLGDQAAHLSRVLRGEPGMEFDVVAGDQTWHAVIATVNDQAVEFRLLEAISSPQALPLTVLLSIFKFDRLEWAIEKLTELGVVEIQPLIARRTEKHLEQASARRVERWRRIALEAAKQSRQAAVLTIHDPASLKKCLGSSPNERNSDFSRLRLVLSENESDRTLLQELNSSQPEWRARGIHLAVGPEGGWTREEESSFREHGWLAVSLGPTILRAETAAIASVAIVAAAMQRSV